ncbi:4-hydroxy-tetrahydrodipicolinate synthase [Granulicoccus phenolivorans]|uniref:4-hydroxy-tetrahydrodipicolinate synthase n=1 Tax=Granulicoccus phenolivorans TaxID=266854 RepID=UPI00047D2477|nr:4-hydroxy-tetrahydrodipicolinate synthase [Granulicoccus phenolivorans]
MTNATAPHSAPFGQLLTAMVTPFDAEGEVDFVKARELAAYLVDEMHNDALVISGTTGESPTTTRAEKRELLVQVIDEIGDRAQVVAGVGTNDTRSTIALATDAAEVGADGLLVVTPYYSKPPQSGLLAHFRAVGDATELPIIMYDIPHRSGAAIEEATLIELAEHPRIVAVKDAKGNLPSSSLVMARTDLAYYSGDDAMTLPLLAVGGVGLVGTSTHFTGAQAKQMIQAYAAGDTARALELHRRLYPAFVGVFATQGCILVKAGLELIGRPVGGLRSPMPEATAEQRDAFAACLSAAGLH